jgi:hypothetical protein
MNDLSPENPVSNALMGVGSGLNVVSQMPAMSQGRSNEGARMASTSSSKSSSVSNDPTQFETLPDAGYTRYMFVMG